MVDFDLNIDPTKVKEKLISSIKATVEKQQTTGALVFFDGQNDSFVNAKLAIEALGLDSVKLIIIIDIPESKRKEISFQATELLNIPLEKIIIFDIEEIVSQFEAFEAIPKLLGVYRDPRIVTRYKPNVVGLLLRSEHVHKMFEEKTLLMMGKSKSEREEFLQKAIAHNKLRKRMETLLTFLIAERESLTVINQTNKTEWLTGLVTWFGYGHAADIMPLADLYRTQTLQLAESLGIPKEVRELLFTDIIPGIDDEYQYFFELDSFAVDQILVRLDGGLSADKISEELDLDLEKVERVQNFYEVSKFQRTLPFIPKVHDL
ncbi:MAG: hypothetical protein ACFFBD_04185 [Candidatus Hodarchaeota archaeon]